MEHGLTRIKRILEDYFSLYKIRQKTITLPFRIGEKICVYPSNPCHLGNCATNGNHSSYIIFCDTRHAYCHDLPCTCHYTYSDG